MTKYKLKNLNNAGESVLPYEANLKENRERCHLVIFLRFPMTFTFLRNACQLPSYHLPLLEVIRGMRESLDLERCFETAVRETRRLLAADRVMVYQFDSNYIGTTVAESVGDGWSASLGLEIVDTCFQESRAQQYNCKDRINIIPDVYQAGLTECHLQLLEQFQVKANLVAPIFQGSRVWGLYIAHQCRGPRQWQDEDISIMMHIAAQLTLAIQQDEAIRVEKVLELERQARADREKLLHIMAQIPRPLTRPETLLTTVTELRQILAADRVVIYHYDPCQGEGDPVQVTVEVESVDPQYPAIPAADAFPEHRQRIAQMFVSEEFTQPDPNGFLRVVGVSELPDLGDTPIDGGILVAIALDATLWGILAVYQHQPGGHWRESEINLVYQVGVHLTVALQHLVLHEQAQQRIEELQRLHQLKDDFLSTVSHELRTPLASIRVAIEMLKSMCKQLVPEPDPARERVQRYLSILENESQREINLVEDLLNLQRLSERRDPLHPEAIDLKQALTQHIHGVAPLAHQYQLTIQSQLDPHLPVVYSEPVSVDRILRELLTNACKYTSPGGRIVITARAQPCQNQAGVCVSIGNHSHIPAEELPRIFDKFYRVPQGDPWKRGGTGLGLSLVKELLKFLGGTIEVTSEKNWTTFSVWLPLETQN